MEKGLLPFNKQASEVNDFYLQSHGLKTFMAHL